MIYVCAFVKNQLPPRQDVCACPGGDRFFVLWGMPLMSDGGLCQKSPVSSEMLILAEDEGRPKS